MFHRSAFRKAFLAVRRLSLILLTALALNFIAVQAAQAATYYVASNGSDSNPGTLGQPFRTMKKGISVLKPGDTTYVRTGTYAESFDTNRFDFPSGTSWTSAVKVAVYPGETVILRGGFNFGKEPDQYIIIDGFIIEAGQRGTAVAITQGSNHIRIQNCEIRNSDGGITLFWGNNNGLSSDYNEILNNHIHHIGTSIGYTHADGFTSPGYGRAHAIYMSTSNNIIHGNHIHDAGEYGIHQWTFEPHFSNNNVIASNRIHSNGKNTSRYGYVCCGGITISRGTGTIVANNVVYNHFKSGISIGSTAKNVKVFNNTIVDYAGNPYAIHAISGGSGEIKNNISYPRPNSIPAGFTASNNLTTDPKFVNAAGGDFHVQAGSPAIDAGQTLAEVTNDFEGGARPAGAAYDIGAYEFGSPPGSGPSPPPPSGVPPAIPRPPSTYDPGGRLCPI